MKHAIFLLSLGLSVWAWGQDAMVSSESRDELRPVELKGNITIDARIENFDYNESGMTEKGPLVGAAVRWRQDLDETFALQLDLEAVTGQTYYTGETWTAQPILTHNEFYIAEAGSRLFAKLEPTPLSFLVAGGFRYTFQDKESVGFYRREYNYLYGGFGAQLDAPLTHDRLLWFRTEYDFLVQGSNRTYLSDAGEGADDITLAFTSGWAGKLTAGYSFKFDTFHRAELIFGYTQWIMDRSQTVIAGNLGPVWEPANQTYLVDVSLGYTF